MKAEIKNKICSFLYYTLGYRFIAGKWFDMNHHEIYDMTKRLYTQLGAYSKLIDSTTSTQILDTFIESLGDPMGKWYPLPIIEEAKNYKNKHDLAYPLNIKQLIIIKILLVGEGEHMFILHGVAQSGKSTFANIVKQIFENDVASATLQDLSEDFTFAPCAKKRLIYSDELNGEDLNNGKIKTMISQQAVQVNPKNEKPYYINFQGKLFYACNKPPKLDLEDSGIVRRIIYYSMNTKITNPNTSLQKKVYNHDDLVNIVAHALAVDTTNWEKYFQKETREILRSNNSVYLCKVGNMYPDYGIYVDRTISKRLKPYSEPKYNNLVDLFTEWDKEEEEGDNGV